MSSDNYRYYRLDGRGRLHGADWFEAKDDTDAIARISLQFPNDNFEIWQGTRMVAALPLSALVASSPAATKD